MFFLIHVYFSFYIFSFSSKNVYFSLPRSLIGCLWICLLRVCTLRLFPLLLLVNRDCCISMPLLGSVPTRFFCVDGVFLFAWESIICRSPLESRTPTSGVVFSCVLARKYSIFRPRGAIMGSCFAVEEWSRSFSDHNQGCPPVLSRTPVYVAPLPVQTFAHSPLGPAIVAQAYNFSSGLESPTVGYFNLLTSRDIRGFYVGKNFSDGPAELSDAPQQEMVFLGVHAEEPRRRTSRTLAFSMWILGSSGAAGAPLP